MDLKRAKAIGKLVVLFGTPLAVIFGLFSCGVYCGYQNRHGITGFEKNVLGFDVEVAPKEDADKEDADKKDADKEDEDKKDADKQDEDKKDADKVPETETKETTPQPQPQPEPEPEPQPQPTPQPTPQPQPDPTTIPQPVPVPVAPTPETKADPLEGPLARRLATPVTVRVKVLVDEALIGEQPAWIDYVQRTISRASQVYHKQFGIELELASVGRWPVALDGLSAGQLLEDVQARPREGADVVVGFTNRPFDDRVAGKAGTPSDDSPFNAAAAVVYATPGHHDAHLRSLLHEVGHLFSALDIVDPQDDDYKSGSWMSYAPVPESQAPWIDAKNRERILNRKDKPFRPEEE